MPRFPRRQFLYTAAGTLVIPGLPQLPPPDSQIIRTGLWQRLDVTGLERFELSRAAGGWQLRGRILAKGPQGATECGYLILCDPQWRTTEATISASDEAGTRETHVIVKDGRWHINGREDARLAACVDIDLEWTPATNTIPIRRLTPAVGKSTGALTMAWVRFPGLAVEPLRQQYDRLAERQYRYTSVGGDFTAKIDVDDQSLALEYEGLWRRVT